MFGERTLNKSMRTVVKGVSEETLKELTIASDKMQNIANMTGEEWWILSDKALSKVRAVCYFEGAAVFASSFFAARAILTWVSKLMDKHAQKEVISDDKKERP